MTDILTAHADAQPGKVAVIDDRPDDAARTVTYLQLEQMANQLAHVLLDHGAGPGTKIAWCGQNSLEVVTFINAARKIAAVAVPINYRLSDDEAAYVTDHCDAAIVYVDAAYASLYERIRGRLPQVDHYLVHSASSGGAPAGMFDADRLGAAAPSTPPTAAQADGTATPTMIYTSGTTGKPKGAYRRQGMEGESVAALMAEIGYRPDDVYLTTGPLYHSGPSGFMGVALALGQTIVVQHKFEPEDWLRLVDTYRCTSTFAAPTPIRMVCNLPDEVKQRYDRSSMRIMIANAAPWSFALKQQYVADFGNDSLFEVYGSTELGVNTLLRPEDQLRKPGSCGRAAPGVGIRLYDDDGGVVTGTGADAAGELYVRSETTFEDYYKQHDKFEEDHRDGYQTVGDIAYRDDEGFFYICDRKKDMIISGGMNIYPAEIEAALEEHPGILEAAVFGIPDEEWGEQVHAVIVGRDGETISDDDIQQHARAHLARYKVPRSIDWIDELPKTGSGKILKRELRAPYWKGHEAKV